MTVAQARSPRNLMRFALHLGLSKLFPQPVPVALLYHTIGENVPHPFNNTPAQFESQLRRLRERGHRFLGMDEVEAGIAGGGSAFSDRDVCLTFDDGYRDNLTAALPILERYQAPAIVYVATDYVRNGKTGKGFPILDKSELKRLADHPLIDIGGHTRSHPRLTTLPPDRALAEMRDGKSELEDWTGRRIRHFAYPKGDLNAEVARLAAEAGFATATTIRPMHLREVKDPYRIGRVPVDRSLPEWLFPAAFTRSFSLYENLKRRIGPRGEAGYAS